jgi:predicted RNase H-like HicB family nuclease
VRYPVAIEIGTESTAYGVVVPDLPGCFSAGETIDDAVIAAEEAATAWIDATLDAGMREALFRPILNRNAPRPAGVCRLGVWRHCRRSRRTG